MSFDRSKSPSNEKPIKLMQPSANSSDLAIPSQSLEGATIEDLSAKIVEEQPKIAQESPKSAIKQKKHKKKRNEI